MLNEPRQNSFGRTVPAMLTAVTAGLTLAVGLIVVLNGSGQSKPTSVAVPAIRPALIVAEPPDILEQFAPTGVSTQSGMRDVTPVIEEITAVPEAQGQPEATDRPTEIRKIARVAIQQTATDRLFVGRGKEADGQMLATIQQRSTDQQPDRQTGTIPGTIPGTIHWSTQSETQRVGLATIQQPSTDQQPDRQTGTRPGTIPSTIHWSTQSETQRVALATIQQPSTDQQPDRQTGTIDRGIQEAVPVERSRLAEYQFVRNWSAISEGGQVVATCTDSVCGGFASSTDFTPCSTLADCLANKERRAWFVDQNGHRD